MLDELYWLFKTGRPKRKLTVFQLRSELNKYIQKPVFFLSTGRCGTKWFSELFVKDKSLSVFHAPIPDLSIQGKYAWEITRSSDIKISSMSGLLLSEIFFSGREQHLRYTAKAGKRYVETNNYITFFAPVLADIFPDSQFVQIVRDPVSFIRSGIDRSYYIDGNVDDLKRIREKNESEKYKWESLSRYGKVAWLWNETNAYIKEFSKHISDDRFMTFPFDLSETGGVKSIIEFLDFDIPERKIRAQLSRKKNAQKERHCPPFEKWSQKQKQEVISITSELADNYNFQF
jgi:hypothetical protein